MIHYSIVALSYNHPACPSSEIQPAEVFFFWLMGDDKPLSRKD
jgi:hypothetical protein